MSTALGLLDATCGRTVVSLMLLLVISRNGPDGERRVANLELRQEFCAVETVADFA
jgi:hypothetical protein